MTVFSSQTTDWSVYSLGELSDINGWRIMRLEESQRHKLNYRRFPPIRRGFAPGISIESMPGSFGLTPPVTQLSYIIHRVRERMGSVKNIIVLTFSLPSFSPRSPFSSSSPTLSRHFLFSSLLTSFSCPFSYRWPHSPFSSPTLSPHSPFSSPTL